MFYKILIVILVLINAIVCQPNSTVELYSSVSPTNVSEKDNYELGNDTTQPHFQTPTANTSVEENDGFVTDYTFDYVTENSSESIEGYSESTKTTESRTSLPPTTTSLPSLSALVYLWITISVIYLLLVIVSLVLSLKKFLDVITRDDSNTITSEDTFLKYREQNDGTRIHLGQKLEQASLPPIPKVQSNIDEASIRSKLSAKDSIELKNDNDL